MKTVPSTQEGRKRILIVDDDPSMVHLLARTLLDVAQLHFSVRGEDALMKLEMHAPDLVLIDADMPDLSGYEVIERMRRIPNCARTQVIMVTAHDSEQYRTRAVQSGAVDFFIKPINRSMMRERVEQLLNPSEPSTIDRNASEVPSARAVHEGPGSSNTVVQSASEFQPKQSLRSDAITSELFDRMSAILEQTESLRSRWRKDMKPADELSISRIEEQCAEVVQLLVTLSDPEGNEKL